MDKIKRPNHRPNKTLKTEKILNDEYYTIYEVADILKVHHTTIRRAINEGRLKAFKIGTKWLIKADDIEKLGDK
jgi:excisionase family DNA binding protein